MIYRKTYQITDWREWDHTVNRAARDFQRRYLRWPMFLLASSNTFHDLDMRVSNTDRVANVRDMEGESPPPGVFAALSSFTAEEYALEFCVEERIARNCFWLIWDSDPGGGEPIPFDDSPPVVGERNPATGGTTTTG